MSKSSVTTTTSVTTVSVDQDSGRTQMNVLIVDDNKDTCDSLLQVAMMLGIEAHGATSESEARAMMMVSPFPFDAVVFDWWIQPDKPGGGIRLLNWIRSSEGPGAMVPCVLMTGMPPTDMAKEPTLPADDHYLVVVHKPIEPTTIFSVLSGMVEGIRKKNKEKSDAATAG